MRLAGIDGCKDGWLAVIVDSGAYASARIDCRSSLASLIEENHIDLAVVDIPIGLSSGPKPRNVETSARKQLVGRSSSVFNTPCRQALDEDTYERASSTNSRVLGVGLSKQSWALFPKIREADVAVLSLGQDRIKEGHPEVSFSLLSGEHVFASKKRAKGAFQRIKLLEQLGYSLGSLAMTLPEKNRAAIDDFLDAAVLTWSAERTQNKQNLSFPRNPQNDSQGLEMAIVA